MAKTKGSGKAALWLHPTGQWCKKFRGVNYYFGTDPEQALRRYAEEWDDILAGAPRRQPLGVGYTVADLANAFLNAKRLQVDGGELSSRMWSEYHRACEVTVEEFGKARTLSSLRAIDFGRFRAKLASRLGPFALSKMVQMIRTMFAYAYDVELLEAPIRYGNQFDKPPRRVLRLERAKAGPKLLTAAEIWKLLDAADSQMKAMILLGLNCAYGQTDLAGLQRSHLVSRPGWLEEPRQKSGVARRAKLWPETVKALAAVAKARPPAKAKADAGCVFITRTGQRWVKFVDRGADQRGVRNDSLGQMFKKLARSVGLKRTGFYTLRHTFRTVADSAKDLVAIRVVMGHHDAGIDDSYRERVDDERIAAVCETVRKWLMKWKPKGKGANG